MKRSRRAESMKAKLNAVWTLLATAQALMQSQINLRK